MKQVADFGSLIHISCYGRSSAPTSLCRRRQFSSAWSTQFSNVVHLFQKFFNKELRPTLIRQLFFAVVWPENAPTNCWLRRRQRRADHQIDAHELSAALYECVLKCRGNQFSSSLKGYDIFFIESLCRSGTVSLALLQFTYRNRRRPNLRVWNIRVSNRTLIYNVCPKSALTWPSRHSRHRHLCRFYRSRINR